MQLAFNPGARFDTSALPVCRASDEQVQILAVRACPKATKLGEVRTQGVYAGGAPFDAFATLFNARGQIIVVVALDSFKGRLLTNFRDDVRGSTITINLKIPRGISLIRFQAHVPRHYLRRHGKRRAYFRTPELPCERRLDHYGDLQLQGRVDRPAHGRFAVPWC